MSTISPLTLPNLYDVGAVTPRLESHAALAGPSADQTDLSATDRSSRALPEAAVEHHAALRYTRAQLEMRPVDRSDAALMAVVEPGLFRDFVQAVATDGDWRGILQPFAERLQQRPEWLEDRYRLPAAEVLRRSNYLMDLAALVRLGLADHR